MKYIITERQYRLLSEQKEEPKVYTDKTEYDKAMKNYTVALNLYNVFLTNEKRIKKSVGKDFSNYQFVKNIIPIFHTVFTGFGR